MSELPYQAIGSPFHQSKYTDQPSLNQFVQHSHTQKTSQLDTDSDSQSLTSFSSDLNLKYQRYIFNSEKKSATAQSDRFIPHRPPPRPSAINLKINDQNTIQDIKSNSVCSLFHQYIIDCPVHQQQSITAFQNKNLFRYNNQNSKQRNQAPWLAGFQLRQSLASHRVSQRKVGKAPVKVLDAPSLQDDYYLNLIDWSKHDFLAVGLAGSAYLWSPRNAKVTRLCELPHNNLTTAVGCADKQPLLAVGALSGEVQVWDAVKEKKTLTLQGHTQRVGAATWNGSLLTTGSRDKTIILRDIRMNSVIVRLVGHKQEVCGLKWSPDGQQLCSGGNDNRLLVWSQHSLVPLLRFSDHTAAVKAVAWSPHQHGLLASGGGTADRTIKFRNTLTGQTVGSWQTGSQVCNLAFSQSLNELVSTHGFSQNQVALWDCSRMQKVASLTGHTYRVLYLAMSPDGTTVVTGAGDETLRFWDLFPPSTDKCYNISELQECKATLR